MPQNAGRAQAGSALTPSAHDEIFGDAVLAEKGCLVLADAAAFLHVALTGRGSCCSYDPTLAQRPADGSSSRACSCSFSCKRQAGRPGAAAPAGGSGMPPGPSCPPAHPLPASLWPATAIVVLGGSHSDQAGLSALNQLQLLRPVAAHRGCPACAVAAGRHLDRVRVRAWEKPAPLMPPCSPRRRFPSALIRGGSVQIEHRRRTQRRRGCRP